MPDIGYFALMAQILIIEDDRDLRVTLKAALEDAGHGVVDVSDGQAALDTLHDGQPDLIVSDIVMDGMEGIAAIMAFRKALPDIPVIAMSGNEFYLNSSEKLGANVTLLKPFSRRRLLAEVDGLLGISAAHLSTAS